MTTITIDTYALVTKLKEAGVPEQQAAAQVEIITKTIDTALEQARHDYDLDNLATKRDLKDSENVLQLKISESKADLQRWIIGVVFGAGILQTAIIAALVLKLAGHI
jgi:carbamoylphosphate synthase small subunit